MSKYTVTAGNGDTIECTMVVVEKRKIVEGQGRGRGQDYVLDRPRCPTGPSQRDDETLRVVPHVRGGTAVLWQGLDAALGIEEVDMARSICSGLFESWDRPEKKQGASGVRYPVIQAGLARAPQACPARGEFRRVQGARNRGGAADRARTLGIRVGPGARRAGHHGMRIEWRSRGVADRGQSAAAGRGAHPPGHEGALPNRGCAVPATCVQAGARQDGVKHGRWRASGEDRQACRSHERIRGAGRHCGQNIQRRKISYSGHWDAGGSRDRRAIAGIRVRHAPCIRLCRAKVDVWSLPGVYSITSCLRATAVRHRRQA